MLTEPEELRPFECDGLTVYRRLPMIAVLPNRVEEVQRIVRVAAAQGVPVVARGAGTGLSGGALPLEDGLLLSLSKFNRILELDPKRRLARVEPGVRNLAISEAADPHGLYYAPDPSSQIACSIGGTWPRTRGGCTASSTGSPSTTSSRSRWSTSREGFSPWGARRSTLPATTSSPSSPDRRGCSGSSWR